MKDDPIYREMCRHEADGVDFVPLVFDGRHPSIVYESYTKEEWEKQRFYPKTRRAYWKIDESGNKVYLDWRE